MTSLAAGHDIPMPAYIRNVFARPLLMAVTTINADGGPHVSLVWQETQADTVVFFADAGSSKIRNLRRNPRVAGLVVDDLSQLGEGVPCWGSVLGEAVIEPRDDDLVQRLTARYMRLNAYPFGGLATFLVVRIHPTGFSGNLPLRTSSAGT